MSPMESILRQARPVLYTAIASMLWGSVQAEDTEQDFTAIFPAPSDEGANRRLDHTGSAPGPRSALHCSARDTDGGGAPWCLLSGSKRVERWLSGRQGQ